MRIFKNLLGIIFPNHCLHCEEIISADGLFCQNCWPKLQFISEPKCAICAYPFEFQAQSSICLNCLKKKPAFDETIAVFSYNYILRKVISDLKYRDQTFLAKKLSKILFSKIQSRINDFNLIIAVPLHKKRLQKRKFNQAVLLAKNIQKLEPRLEFFPDILIRTKYQKSQVELRKIDREKNLKTAFALNEKYRQIVKNKNILLLDDVMTTGATLQNCAKILKKSGAAKITVFTIAKTTFR
jgi:competence protein ComFC